MTSAELANHGQAEIWNSTAGRTWVELQDLLDRLFAPVEAAVVEAGFPGEGARVLDIGCGAGATTRAMARRVGPKGRCVGVDISQPLVEAARVIGVEAGVISYIAADAQSHAFEPGAFDAVISRFGVMFFDDPVQAFANIRQALRPGGGLAFATWRSPAENPFMTAAARAAAPLLPAMPAGPVDGPGQFGLADPQRTQQLLAAAGWSDIKIVPFDGPVELTKEELLIYARMMGPVGVALQGMPEAARAPIVEAVMRGFAPFTVDGGARFNMACWMVTAST